MAKRFIIIGRTSCPFCTMSLDLLAASKIPSVFLDYESSQEILEEYKEFHGHSTVPIVLENDLDTGYTVKIGGYTELLECLGG
jgi:glutaredoxin